LDTAAVGAQETYGTLFANSEFRALWVAQILSVLGDQLARVALTLLVYDRTRSPLLAAITFAASILPVFVGGLVLSGLADRLPRREVMIACDLARMALVLIMAIPGVPLLVLVALLFLVTMISTPFTSARTAMYPDILPGDSFALGTAVTMTTYQIALIFGFACGGAVVGFFGVRPCLIADAATFALSALITFSWVRYRPAARPGGAAVPADGPDRPGAPGPDGGSATAGDAASARNTATGGGVATVGVASDPAGAGTGRKARYGGAVTEGVRMVFARPALRTPMLLGCLSMFYNAPEGIAAPLAHSLGAGTLAAGLILTAGALGPSVGAVTFTRLVRPAVRTALMRPLAIACCATLMLFALHPPLPAALLILVVAGLFDCYQVPAVAAFVHAAPASHRSQVFGVAQAAMSLGQGAAMIAAGAIAEYVSPSATIALSGAVGAVAAAVISAGPS
jgi:predicted MFS family arabinose efflux permease